MTEWWQGFVIGSLFSMGFWTSVGHVLIWVQRRRMNDRIRAAVVRRREKLAEQVLGPDGEVRIFDVEAP